MHIWNGVKQGNKTSQKALYEHTCNDLMNICRRYLMDHSLANDAFQEAYIKILTKSESFDKRRGTLGAWMARITVNECLQILRRQKRVILLDVVKTEREPHFQEDIVSDLSAEEIYAEVEKLSDRYRIVFNLYVVEGYSHNEIGEILGISPSTSRSQLCRAKIILQKAIKKKSNPNTYEQAK